MASIRRRKDRKGQWEVSFYVQNGAKRERIRKIVSAATKGEAQVRLAELMAEHHSVDRFDSDMTLGVALSAWKIDTERNADEVKRAQRFVEWFGSDEVASKVTTRDVNRWIDERKKSVEGTTVRRELSAISSLFQWALRREEVASNPIRNANKPSGAYDPPPDVPEVEIPKSLEAVRGHSILEPAYLLALVQGLRRGEIVSAQWTDVDFERATLHVRGTKTKRSDAVIPLFEPALSWMRANRRESGFIVRSAKTGDAVLPNSVQNCIDRFNVTKERKIELPNLHRCRHTCATMLVKRGVPAHMVTAFLRWSSTDMLESVYRHYNAVHFRPSLSEIESAFKSATASPREPDEGSTDTLLPG